MPIITIVRFSTFRNNWNILRVLGISLTAPHKGGWQIVGITMWKSLHLFTNAPSEYSLFSLASTTLTNMCWFHVDFGENTILVNIGPYMYVDDSNDVRVKPCFQMMSQHQTFYFLKNPDIFYLTLLIHYQNYCCKYIHISSSMG